MLGRERDGERGKIEKRETRERKYIGRLCVVVSNVKGYPSENTVIAVHRESSGLVGLLTYFRIS